MTETVFFRLLESDDKAIALQHAIAQLAQGQNESIVFSVNPDSFQQVPGSPFSYWVSEKIRASFQNLERLGSNGRVAKQGLATAEDFRFLRTSWETSFGQNSKGEYLGFAKGGAYSRFYSDIYLRLFWDGSGEEISSNLNEQNKIKSNIWMLKDTIDLFFEHPGLTYSRRSQKGLSVRVMPEGCIFADKGPGIFATDNDSQQLLALLAITNSSAFRLLVELQMAFGSYEVGVIQRTPIANLSTKDTETLANLARRAWSLKRNFDTVTQTSHAFILPALLQVRGASLRDRSLNYTSQVTQIEQQLAQIQTEIDDRAFDLYGITERDRITITQTNTTNNDTEDEDETEAASDLLSLTKELLDYTVGLVFGRFDIRLATGDRTFPTEPEPFDPLPVCAPGMLTTEAGLPPTCDRDLPADYAIDIPFNGILVDDEGHDSDLIRRVQSVIDLVWNNSDIEQEACQILGVRTLRDYFRKPTAFFDDHLKRYSKSRRQAPLYLPISTQSGSYTLWLYYHRLTDQTLYTCINDYLDPKLHHTQDLTQQLRNNSTRTPAQTKQLETLTDLETDLRTLRDDLLRIAKLPYHPNLNDGVQITVAPLWSLFRLPKWQKKLKETWQQLEKGDYDWAHLAHSIWTDRVRQKCKHDKSLAIAHTLEHLYEPPPEQPKRKRKTDK
jgi:hypothetical protein